MGKINISNWKEFHLYDIFEIDSGNKLDKVKMKTENPEVNFVGRANTNNGITAVVDRIEGIKPYKSGYLTLALGGSYLGSCFIQKEKFYTSQNVIVLKPKHELTLYSKIFIASIIFKESQMHYRAFVDELNPHIKDDFTIKLPVNKNGKPDYGYMDKYIKEKKDLYDSYIKTYDKIGNIKNKNVNISKWKEFKIKDIFITNQKGNNVCVPTGASITKRELINGDTPRITVSNTNNGIVGYYHSKSKNYRKYENFISVSFLGTVFYQKGRASLDMKVHCLQLKDRELNTNLGLYLATIIREGLKNSSYADQISSTVLPNIVIKLPVDKDEKPDYNYMEKYVFNKIKENKDKFNTLKKITNN